MMEVRVWTGARNFSIHHRVQTGSGTLSLGVKQLGREADHSPPSSVEVKERVSVKSTGTFFFKEWVVGTGGSFPGG
jgi:hypothetical protein